jgi:hypothetical protein
LYVHILNGAVFALVLQLLDQRQWLVIRESSCILAGDRGNLPAVFRLAIGDCCWLMTSRPLDQRNALDVQQP